ncbi:YbaB/EbfC family nucleoid-associated protein [Amycolatopsis sp. FU40]|uniref:YbaB/EbfC family nucleoid-associated protein n=1 Tax=Amycolatopsis sp. FU40 TaxID=2914159 RepID=UPI001F268876|nr:YbaB/EbfC family nucleoid-associated protein [Amycolatopsis sp. FU40]UKD51097.1 YbaB/EbfC family nucleoid-associated protein [Amycolatopsis sp. FU40]
MTVDILKALGIGAGHDVAARQRRLADLDAELAGQRFRGASRDSSVTATVNGRGEIVDIVVRDDALRSPHPELVGPAVVEAVNRARTEAGQHARAAVSAVVHPDAPPPAAPPEPAAAAFAPPAAATALAPPAAPARRGRADDDEDFGDYDFLALEE